MGNSREGVGSNSVVQEQPSLEDVGDALGKLRTLLAKQETPSDFGNALVDLVERHIVAQVGSEAKAVFNEARAVQLLEDLEQSRDVQKIITITEQLETLAKENPEYVERFAERMSEKLREELALPSYRQNKELIGSIGSSLMTMEAEDSKALGILIHLYVRRPPEECPGILQYLVSKGERTTQSLGNQLKFDDLDPVSRARICLALSEIGNVESLNILREETETSREPEQRLIALNMLAHAAMKGSPYDYDSLLPLLTEVCEAFAEVAEIRSGPGKKSFCVDPLSSQVSAHEVLWRQDIQHDYARALASFGSDASIATLTEVLRNFDEIEVADLAGMILGVQSRRSTPSTALDRLIEEGELGTNGGVSELQFERGWYTNRAEREHAFKTRQPMSHFILDIHAELPESCPSQLERKFDPSTRTETVTFTNMKGQQVVAMTSTTRATEETRHFQFEGGEIQVIGPSGQQNSETFSDVRKFMTSFQSHFFSGI